MRIALVKQEIYQDLYVCPKNSSPEETLLSSIMRVGPIGLIEELNADFYIVKQEKNIETQLYRKVIPHITPYLHLLKTKTADKLPGQAFKSPGSPFPNGKFAVDCNTIDWGLYDIVISINIALPTHVVLKHPKTLFCYMIGEANMATDKARFGYDATLNQMARGIISKQGGVIDFPYTFIGANTLEKLMFRVCKRPSKKKGCFMEINSTTERPVTKIPPTFYPLRDAGYEIILHKQNIKDNLISIYDSKYFIKIGGRCIRGNSVAEAISLGSLAIMDRNQVIHKELILDECNVKNMQDVIALITKLDNDEELYLSLLTRQRAILDRLFYNAPLQSLKNCLEAKRNGNYRPYTPIDKIRDIKWLYIGNQTLLQWLKSKLFTYKK